MKNIIGFLSFVLLGLSACQGKIGVASQPTDSHIPSVTELPTSELMPYYGDPQPAILLIDGKSYLSEIGTTQWIYIDSAGEQYMEIGDAFAIITPARPIHVKPPLTITLVLPIPINPTDLWYRVFSVTDKDGDYDPSNQIVRWNPPPQEQIFLPLLSQQKLTFSLAPGIYVLEVNAGWGGVKPWVELEANYGFLMEIQE